MQIIIINDYASIQGGAAQVAITSATALANAGYHISFVYATGGVDPLLQNHKILN